MSETPQQDVPPQQFRQPPPPGMGMPPPPMNYPPGPHQIIRPPMPMNLPPQQPSMMQKIMEEPLNPPNPTLYVQNLNERVKAADLKNALYQLFSNYGEVIEVHAKKNIKMRGQAFVVCQDEEAADSAIQALRGYMFFGKPLRLNYAKTRSDVTAKMRGTFDEEVKAKRELRRQHELKQRQLKQKRKIIDKFLKLRSDNEEMQNLRGGPSIQKIAGFSVNGQESNNLLFIEGLSKRTPTSILNEIFSQAVIGGFKEVRHIAEKEVAFVEYEDDHVASIAMNALQGYQIKESNGETTVLSISFAKR
eukprot:403373310